VVGIGGRRSCPAKGLRLKTPPLFSGVPTTYARTKSGLGIARGLFARDPEPALVFRRVSARGLISTMKRSFHNSARVAWATVLILPLATTWARTADAASPFPDKNLEVAIRAVLKHEPNVELTDEKLQNVYFLEAPGKDIKDLTGLEKCKNLALIKLSKNKISDLKPLKDLTNLQSLDLADNAIKDIGPLANLKGLQYIELSNNQVEKLEPLSGLTSLTSLYLGRNAIKDIAPLAPLTKLWTLSAPKNQIKDLAALEKVTKLSTLDLCDNQVENVSPLSKQTELSLLLIERNQIKDLKPLVESAKADAGGPKRFAPYLRLYLSGNPLPDAVKSAQLEAFKAAGVRIEG
jgi:internalin A